MLDRDFMVERLEYADREGFYIFYQDNDFRLMSDEELRRKYINMMEFLSESGAFRDWSN